jgi:hypothetical protein
MAPAERRGAMSDLVALRPGTILADDYRIERTLGAGGFGITYLAEEIALARLVTIKEYFPVDFAARDQAEDVVPRSRESEGDYTWGLDRFLTEAQTLARFNHANIVRVYRFFQARNTGYIVLHYEDGASLKGWLKALGRAPRQNEIDRLLEPLLDALETVHAADYLHRDIAPDNIMIRKDGEPVLIDFGSARGDIAKHSKTISALVKPGYSPYEQYATTSRQQGPWTDIYSLGATLYEAVTGRRPPDAPSRMVSDELVPPADAALSSYRPRFLAAIGKALRLEINDRPRSISDWRAELLAPTPQRREEPRSPEPVAAAQAEPVAAAAAGASKAGGSTKAKAPPEPAAAAVAEAASAPPARRGLAAAFLDGWRKGNAPADVERAPRPRKSAAAPSAPAAAPPADAAPAPAARKKKRRSAVPAAAEMSPQRHVWPFGLSRRHQLPAAPEPGARRATPRALRKRSGQGWRALAAKLVLAFCVAAGMVAIQEQLPTVRREGAGLLTSQTNTDVPLAELKGHRGAVTGLAFLPDSQRIVTSSADGTVKVWNTARGGLIRTIELDAGPATAFAVAKERAATGHKDGTVALWNIETGSNLATFRRSDASIWAIAFAGGPDRVAAAAQDWAVTLWEAGRPQSPVRVFEGHENAVKAVAFAERGPFIASGGADAVVKLWNVDKGELVRTYRGHEEAIAAVAFDPEGRTLASTSQDGQIRLWSTYSSRLKKRLRGHEGSVPGLAYAPDGHYLVSGGSDGTVRIWDTERGKPVRTMKSGVGAVGALGVSPDGRKIAAAGADGTVRVFVAVLPKDGS